MSLIFVVACENWRVADSEMRNPFRSEADAFRLLMTFAIAGAIVIAAGLLVGSWLGLLFAGVFLLLGLRSAVGWLRLAMSDADQDDPPQGLSR